MARRDKLPVDTKAPWQMRVLQASRIRRRGAQNTPPGEGELPVAKDEQATEGAEFLPRFMRTPTGREW